MKKNSINRMQCTLVVLFCAVSSLCAQDKVYQINWSTDGYILGTSAVVYAGGEYFKSNSDPPLLTTINSLNRNDVNAFDRGATDSFSINAKKLSDYIMLPSMALPYLLYLDKRAQQEGIVVGIMGLQTLLFANGISNILKATTKRYRPLNYNPEVPLENKLVKNSRYSFVSGHVVTVASMSFLSARIWTDLHPGSKWNTTIWAAAVVAPAVTGYLRYKAGRHFPTDIIAGYTIGAGVGIIVPNLYKTGHVDISSQLNQITQEQVYTFTWRNKF